MIRQAVHCDLNWIIDLARVKYPHIEFDGEAVKAWGAANLINPNIRIAVGPNSFAVGSLYAPFYAPTRIRGIMLFLASQGTPFEAVGLLRYMSNWALNERGATSFHFGEDTGVNLAPLAKRVGAETDRASYVLRKNPDGQGL